MEHIFPSTSDELLALGQHLEPVTHRENVRRSNSPPGINSRKTHCPAGHEYKARKGEPGTEWGFRYCPRCKNEQRRDKPVAARTRPSNLLIGSPGPESSK